MNKFLCVASALAAVAAAAPASAVTPLTLSPSGDAGFTLNVDSSGTFNEIFEFTWPVGGNAAVSAINISLVSNVDFSGIVLNGVVGTVDNGPFLSTAFATGPLFAGLNSFTITGTGTPGAAYSGTVTVQSAVPEPATWAMMLLGFGLVGAGIRSRRVQGTPVTA